MKKTIKYLQDGEYHYATVKDVGDIDLLKTKTKDDLVGAINELVTDGITVNEDKLNEVVDKINNTQQQIGQTIEQAKANSEGISEAQKEVIAIRTQVAEQYQEALKNFKEAQDKLDKFKQQAAKDLADATDELRKQTLTDIAQAQAANIKELSDNLKVIQDNLNATTVDLAKLRTQLSDMSDIGQVKVDIQKLQDSLATKVSSKELDELATRVTQNETDVRQTKDELSSKATKNELDLATQRVSAAESKIQQNADNINLTVKKAELNDSLEQYNEGRENRLRDTRDFGKSWSLQGSDIGDDHPFDPQHNVKTVTIKPGNGISQTTDLTDDDLGNPFLLSMWVEQGVVPVVTYGAVTLPTPQVTETKNGYERKVFKFTPDKAGQVLTIKSGNNTTAMVMGEPKLEQGYFPTAYTPNSNDDYQSTVSLASSLSVQANKIEATVEKQSRSDGEIEGLKSRVTQTENGIELANKNLKHTADGLTQQFEGKLSATAQSLTTEYDRKTDEKIGQITDSGENLILNSAFTNDKDRLAHWQNVSNWVHVNQDSNQLNWAVIDRSGLSSDSPVSLESNYFNVQKGKITVAVDIQSSDTSRLDNDSILVLSMYNSSYSRVDFRELTLNDLGLTKAILQDRATHRGMYRYGLDRSDVTYMTVKAQVKRNGLIKFTNFSAKASSIDNGGYTRNANDDQEQIINQNTKIEQNSSSISLKANQVDVTRAVSDSETRSTGKISEAENRINTTINNTKSQLENRIVEEKNAAIKVASDSIDSSVSRITRDFNNKFDNLRISNLNLLYDTDPSEVRGYNVTSRYRWFTASGGNGTTSIKNSTGDNDPQLYAKHYFAITGNTNGDKDFQQVISLAAGTYTLSFKVRIDASSSTNTATGQVRTWDMSNSKNLSVNTFTINGKGWVDQSVTFTINEDHMGSPYNPYGNAVGIQMGITGAGAIDYAEPMLVKGGTPVEWGTNPGDIDSNPNLLTTDVANLIIDDSANTRTSGFRFYTAYSELKEDTYYTVSYSATGSKLENNLFDIAAYDLDGSVAYSYESAVADGQRRSVVLRTGMKKNPNDKISLLLYAGKWGKTQGKTVFVKDLTLTEGTAPHAYSPSVADTATNGQVTSWIKKSESDWKVEADKISGRVTTVENNVKTNESRLSQAQLQLMDNHFSTTVEQVKSTSNKLNNLSIGGTNLLMGTKTFDSKYWYSSGTNSRLESRRDDSTSKYIHAWANWASYKNNQTITLDPNKDYIISADIAIEGGDGNGLFVTAFGTLDGKDRALSNDYKVSNVTHLSDGFTRISLPFVCRGKTLTTFRIEGHGNWSTAHGSVYISHIKLEVGNRATAWSPSFDELATNDNLNSQIQATQSKIDQTAESIRAEVKNTNGRLSTLEQTANGISTKVTNTTNSLNDLIGQTRWTTRTGALDANTLKSTARIFYQDIKATNTPNPGWFYIMVDAPSSSRITQTIIKDKTTDKWTRVYNGSWSAWTQEANKGDISQLNGSISQIKQNADKIQTSVNSATGRISMLEQTANGLTSTVANLGNTINGLQIGGTNILKGTKDFDSKYWYSSGTNSRLESRRDDSTSKYIHAWADWASYKNNQTITLDPNKDYIISADIAIHGGDGNGLFVNAFGTLDGKARALSNGYKVSNVTHLSDGFTRISLPFVCRGKTLTTFRIEGYGNWSTAVGSVYISHIKLEEGNVATAWSPAPEDMFSQIQQNADGISTKVAKGDVISTINQSAESVRISAGKINIDGNTDISGTLNVKNVILQGNSGKVDLTGGSIDIDSNDGSHGVSINPLFVQIGKGDFYTRVYDAGQLFYSKNDTNRITSMAQIGPSRFGTIATDPNLRGVTLTAVPTSQNKDSNYEGGNYISLGYQDPAKEAGHITNQLYVTWRDLHYTPTGGKDGLIAKGVHIADRLTFDEGISTVNFNTLLFKGSSTQDPLMIKGWKFSDSAQSGYYQPTLLAGYNNSVHADSMISFLWNSVKVIGTLDLSGVKIRSNGVDWTPTVGWVSWSVWHNVPHFAIYGGSGSNTAGYAMSADGAPIVFGRGALAGWQGNGWVRV